MAFLNQGGAPWWRRMALFLREVVLSLLPYSSLAALNSHAQLQENEVKAAFLYHFTQFVEWPTNAFAESESPLVIGVLGEDPFGRTLDALVQGENIRGRSLQVRRFTSAESAHEAHILFVSQGRERDWPAILRTLGDKPVLTVSEINNFALRGGIIQFYNDDNRVRLRINHNNARQAGLSVSSKLLRVAEVIDSD